MNIPPSMAAIHPWFFNGLLKPAGPQPAGPPALEDEPYKIKAILQINKCGTHSKVKWICYDFSQIQWIKLFKLRVLALDIVKTF